MTSVTLANGAVNSSAGLDIKINGTTKAVSLNTSGAVGVGTTPNYGTAGQVLTSAGTGAAPTWQSDISGNAATATLATNATNASFSTTQTAGDNSTKIATTAFVSNAAFNSNLPSQAGNAGKYVTTDGTTASWANININPVYPIGTDLSATDYTLTTPTTLSSSITSPVMQAVNLDGTKQVMLIGGSSSLQAVVYDGSAFGTMVLVRSGNFSVLSNFAVIAISSTSVLVSSLVAGSNSLETVVLSISGTTITVNTAVATTLAAVSTLITANTRFVACGSSYVLNYYISATTLPAFRAITVSGTTPTVGSELALSNGTVLHHSYAYTSSVLLSLCSDTTTIYVQPISVSGTTLTAGTSATVTSNASSWVSGVLSSGRVAMAYPTSASTQVSCSVISVTGTVATISTAATTLTVGTLNPVMQVYGSQAFVLSGYAGGDRIGLLTDTAGVASVGTPVTVSGAARMVGYLSTGKVFLSQTSGTGYWQYGISGSTVVLEKTFPNATPSIVAAFGNSPFYTQPLSGPSVSGTSGTQYNPLRTASGKTAFASSTNTLFNTSIDGNYIAKVQQNPWNYSNTTYNDGISTAIGWVFYPLQAASTTTLVIRKMVLS